MANTSNVPNSLEVEGVDENLGCVKCGNNYLYVSATRLQCKHILCDDCGSGKKVLCPICPPAFRIRDRLQVLSKKIAQVTSQEKRASRLVESEDDMDMSKLSVSDDDGLAAVRRCELCCKSAAQHWCEDCAKWMCEACLNIHQSASLVEWIADECEPAPEEGQYSLGKKGSAWCVEKSGHASRVSV